MVQQFYNARLFVLRIKDCWVVSRSKPEFILRLMGLVQLCWHLKWCPNLCHFPSGIVKDPHRQYIRKGWYCPEEFGQ